MSGIQLQGAKFALRYALWRLGHLARGCEPLSEDAVRVRVDLVMPDSLIFFPDAEVVILGRGGRVLERVFFEEAQTRVSVEALERFRARVGRARVRRLNTVQLRLVSPGRLVRLPAGRILFDLTDGNERRQALEELSLADFDGDDLVWDLGRHTLEQLMAESLFDLSFGQAGSNAGDLYHDLHASLLAEIDADLESCQLSVETDLYGEALQRNVSRLERTGEVAWWRENLVANDGIDPTEASGQWPEIAVMLRRGLFSGESSVTLEEVYVRQRATLNWPVPSRKLSIPWFGRAFDLLFRWLAEERRRRTDLPLLLTGSFGSGKSSLLTVFAETLLRRQNQIVPLLVPLRDLRGASATQPLAEVLIDHVRRRWNVDLDASPLEKRYCLLCDGFDELNLYYLSVASQQWVSECFRSLCLLAERSDIDVLISSRPVLFMDMERRGFEGAECPSLTLRLFEYHEIDQWCVSYRRAAGLDRLFTGDDLEERELLEVARTPLILYMLARICEFEENAFREARAYTRAEIYRWFVDWTESGGYRRDKTKHVVPRNYRDILREIAYFFYRRGDGFVEEEAVITHLRSVHGDAPDRVPTDRNLLVAHMFQPVERFRDEPGHLVEFTHQSFRDYLFAEWIWKRLEPARQGAGLDPKTWNELGIKNAPPPQEVAYLADMISISPWEQILALYEALADADNVHQYWGKWLQYAWDELRRDPRPESVDALRGRVTVTASRAAGLATLGFILRTRCFARLRQLVAVPPERELPSPLSTKELGSLLHLLKTFPDQGVGSDNRRVLLANLSGIVLTGAALDGHQLEHVDFSGARLRNINFSASRWLEADVRDADLEGASLRQCLLTFKATDRASFRKAKFGDSILTHPKDCALVRADFTEADFLRMRLLDLTFEECRLVGNKWAGATRLYSTEDRPSRLVRCELDEAAEEFFVEQGFELEDCRLAVEDLREVEDPSV